MSKFKVGDKVVYVKHHPNFGNAIPIGRTGVVEAIEGNVGLPIRVEWDDDVDYDNLDEFEIAKITKLSKVL